MTPEEYCRNKAVPAGSNWYYCTLFHPPESKRKLNALLAFHNELNSVICHSSDVGAAKTTLHWWLEEIERFFSDQARHPVTRELSAVNARDYLLQPELLDCIEKTAKFLQYSEGCDYDTWLRQHAAASGYIWKTAGLACQCTNQAVLATLVTSGCCYGAFELLHHTRHFAALGLNVLPVDLLNKHHLETIVGSKENNSRENDPRGKFFTELFERLDKDLKNCLTDLQTEEGNRILFSIVMLKMLSALCQEYKQARQPITDTRIALTPVRKLWIAWRTQRKS